MGLGSDSSPPVSDATPAATAQHEGDCSAKMDLPEAVGSRLAGEMQMPAVYDWVSRRLRADIAGSPLSRVTNLENED